MPTITNRNGRFRAEVRLSGHPRKSQCFATKRAAERWGARVERELRTGQVRAVHQTGRTLSTAIDAYLAAGAGDRLTAHELRVLQWWRARLGNELLEQLRRAHFYEARDAIRGSLGQVLRPATLNKRLALIAAVLTYALDRDWIQAHPARIRRLTEKNARERYLTPMEREQLLEACSSSAEPALYPLVVCAMLSGARAGELTRLTWRDVDLEQGIAHLGKTKTGVRRPIPLRGRARELLQEVAHKRQAANGAGSGGRRPDYVFRQANGSGPFRYRRAWERARRVAGLTDLRFHDLRHLAASELAMSGASTRELQALLGHASAQMTARYAHFIEDHTRELGDRLQERLFGSSTVEETS